ncbi:MAG: SMC-Scp complex subunit ScpB [archaeon GB-1867-005]|nr:SMC-Scp complex subunit ScpB [Candidatus Culexmicrobium cathedralense]
MSCKVCYECEKCFTCERQCGICVACEVGVAPQPQPQRMPPQQRRPAQPPRMQIQQPITREEVKEIILETLIELGVIKPAKRREVNLE